MIHQGFFEPPNPTAISAWEDPSYFEVKSWSPFESWDSFKYQLSKIWSNARKPCVGRPSLFPLFLPSILAYVLFCLRFNRKILGSVPFYSLVTIIVYCSGYFLLCVRERLLWIVHILGILMGGYVLNKLLRKEYFDRMRTNIVLALFIIVSVGQPLRHLDATVNMLKDIYELSDILRDDYGIQGRIGSNDYFANSLYIAFYLDVPYYGKARKDIDARELESDLRKYDIDYFLVWDEDDRAEELIDYEEITNGELKNLKIYRPKKN